MPNILPSYRVIADTITAPVEGGVRIPTVFTNYVNTIANNNLELNSNSDIDLNADGDVNISATEPSVEITALARAGSTQDILVFAYVPSYPEVYFDTVNTETGPVEIGIISSEVVGDEYIVTAGATGVLFAVGQSYTINTISFTNTWAFGSDGTLYGPAVGSVKVLGLSTEFIASPADNNLNLFSSSEIILFSSSDIILNSVGGSYITSTAIGNQIATQGYVDSAIESIPEILKSIVAASTDFADFKSRIALS
jgi:hypothetical protein